MFNPSRLIVARKRRGLTQSELAVASELSPQILSQYERGKRIPTEETVQRLAEALRLPAGFFGASDLEEPSTGGVSFRGLAAMTARQRDMATSAGGFAIALNRWIEARFRLPVVDLPSMRGFEPEAAAEALRAHWKLGQDPCPNMVHLLESRGVRVFSLPRDSTSVHAFSFWHDDVPFVFLTTDTSGEKGRMDAAHEIGHLVLHRHVSPAGRAAEFEADQFASAFLMPRASVLASAPPDFSLHTLSRLKRKWKVSLVALIHRVHRLGLVSEWQYRSLCIDASQLGYRKKEPNSIERETSKVFPKVLSSLRAEGIGRREIARDLLIQPSDFDGIAFGLLVAQGAGSGGASRNRGNDNRPKLKLV